MSQKILAQVGIDKNTPLVRIVVVDKNREKVAIEDTENADNRIELDAAMLEILANQLKKAYNEFYSTK